MLSYNKKNLTQIDFLRYHHWTKASQQWVIEYEAQARNKSV